MKEKKRKREEKEEVFKQKKCRACKSDNLFTFLQLGPTPAPNGFLISSQLDRAEKFYPLDVCFCKECGLVQLAHVVSPEVMFRNYVYIPSTSQTMRDHFLLLAKDAIKKSKAVKKDLVVDIGSNDGTLLKSFQKMGMEILGIDPAQNLVRQANKENVRTICALFSKKIAKKVKAKYGEAKIITATNVVAHVHDLDDFLEGVSGLLSDDGLFIAEFPYLVDLLDKVEFDTIYQEHLSYISVTPFRRLLEKHNLKLFDARRDSVHGGSIKLYITKNDRKVSKTVKELIDLENKKGLMKEETYLKFRRKVDGIRHELVQLLWKLKLENKRVVGYGASAKGNIMLNYCRIGVETLDYVVDSITYKHGKYTPGMHIPIYPEDKLLEDKPDYVLILAWNFAEEIIKKQKLYKKIGGKFIVSVPRVKVV